MIILVLFSHFVGEQKVVAFISFCRRSREYKISRSSLLLFRWLCIIGSGAGCSSTADGKPNATQPDPCDTKIGAGCWNTAEVKPNATQPDPSDTKKSQCGACKKYVSAKDLVRRDRELCKTCAFQQCKCCGKEGELNLAQARKLHNSGEPWYSHLSLLTYLRSSNLRPQTYRPDPKLRG